MSYPADCATGYYCPTPTSSIICPTGYFCPDVDNCSAIIPITYAKISTIKSNSDLIASSKTSNNSSGSLNFVDSGSLSSMEISGSCKIPFNYAPYYNISLYIDGVDTGFSFNINTTGAISNISGSYNLAIPTKTIKFTTPKSVKTSEKFSFVLKFGTALGDSMYNTMYGGNKLTFNPLTIKTTTNVSTFTKPL